ncbi:MAG TPA: DUF1207 domain-containing protein [Gemmatimonadaceae bacterium]
MCRSAIAVLAAPVFSLCLTTSLLAQTSASARCGVGIPAGEQQGYVPLPRGDVFCPLIADPKATRSFASLLRHESGPGLADAELDIASVGIGDAFGLGRWSGGRLGDGIQLSLTAGVFAQFDLGTPSYDMLNADYVVGLPVTIRRGWFSTRVRIYHQSSHLGDEYLLREPPDRQDRENLSFEALEWLISADAAALRIYGGGEMLFNRTPADLGRYVARGGLELRPSPRILPLGSLGGFRFVAAGDVKSSEEQDWDPAISARAGLEYDRAGGGDAPARRWGIFAEFYTGPSPYGQFFREKVRLAGLGIHFGGF